MHVTRNICVWLLETKVFLISNCALWRKIARCVPNEPKIAVHILHPFENMIFANYILGKMLAKLFSAGVRVLMYLNLIRFCVLPFN